MAAEILTADSRLPGESDPCSESGPSDGAVGSFKVGDVEESTVADDDGEIDSLLGESDRCADSGASGLFKT